MPEAPPIGVFPINIRGVTCLKYGLKTGEGVADYAKYAYLSKEEIISEIQVLGVMSDFEPGRKQIEAYPGEKILFVVDMTEQYGEVIFFCYTSESEDTYKAMFQKEKEDELLAQEQLEQDTNAARDLSHLVFEDKPLIAKTWPSVTASETDKDIENWNYISEKPTLSIAITRPKSSLNRSFKFSDVSLSTPTHKVKSQKTFQSNFIMKKENDNGFQAAPQCIDSSAQTLRNKPLNKAVQYEAQSLGENNNPNESSSSSSSPGSQKKQQTKRRKSKTTPGGVDLNNNNDTDTTLRDIAESPFLSFLSKSTQLMESFLKRNKAIEIFHDTFQITTIGADGEMIDASSSSNSGSGGAVTVQVENDLKEIKNFADPTYTKSRVIAAIDWLPKYSGYVAVSAIKNVGFDQRVATTGLGQISHVLLWDFKQLVKPILIMQAPSEVFTMRFNHTNPSYLVGGCITGQVVLWDLSASIRFLKAAAASRTGGSGTSGNRPSSPSSKTRDDNINTISAKGMMDSSLDESSGSNNNNNDDINNSDGFLPISNVTGLLPKYTSTLDRSHKKCVADIFWLPPTTQINHNGELVSEEHLDGQSYQFMTIAADGMCMIWDTRFELIFQDELRHVARAKHMAQEKQSAKEGGLTRPLWSPVFTAHLKRLEGVGELSLCKLSFHPKLIKPASSVGALGSTTGAGSGSIGTRGVIVTPRDVDPRSQFMLGTEEGDVLLADLCNMGIRKHGGGINTTGSTHTAGAGVNSAVTVTAAAGGTGKDEEEDDNLASREYVKWSQEDHSRPAVGFQQSPFFSDILLTVSDWKFNIWKVGDTHPLFSSPLSTVYYTAGCWSPTRPAVLYTGCVDGNIEVWDFSDTSTKASFHLKATSPQRLTSMEFLTSGHHTNGSSGGGGSSTRQQLLACGDDAGTLHIFEVPRSLSRPISREETVMDTFLKKEFERRGEVIHEQQQHSIDGRRAYTPNPTAGGGGGNTTANNTRNKLTSAGGDGSDNNSNDNSTTSSSTSTATALVMTKKEEEEFSLLEAKFIADLNLKSSHSGTGVSVGSGGRGGGSAGGVGDQ